MGPQDLPSYCPFVGVVSEKYRALSRARFAENARCAAREGATLSGRARQRLKSVGSGIRTRRCEAGELSRSKSWTWRRLRAPTGSYGAAGGPPADAMTSSRAAPVIGEALGFEFKARQGVWPGDDDGGAQAQPVGEGAFYLVGGVVGIAVEF